MRARFGRLFHRILRIESSTRSYWVAGRDAGIGWWQRIHGYVYARWPYGYIGAAIGERRERVWQRVLYAPFIAKALFPQRWAQDYHGKVLPLEQAKRLVQVNEPLTLNLPERVIPFSAARDLVVADPDHLVALDCPCRLAREAPCLPLDVCLIVGEPFAGFIMEHHPERARRIDAQEAVGILTAEAQRGHVHHAFFKDAMLGRFYAICNCCTCCCGAMSAHRNGIPMLISSGYVAQKDGAACHSCGRCVSACPFDALTLAEQLSIDTARCMGCGVCTQVCPEGALSLVLDATKPAPLPLPGMAAPPEMAALLNKD